LGSRPWATALLSWLIWLRADQTIASVGAVVPGRSATSRSSGEFGGSADSGDSNDVVGMARLPAA
jgi:hypothetical protein